MDIKQPSSHCNAGKHCAQRNVQHTVCTAEMLDDRLGKRNAQMVRGGELIVVQCLKRSNATMRCESKATTEKKVQ